MRQIMISTNESWLFDTFVKTHLEDGWSIIPGTVVCSKAVIQASAYHKSLIETTYICFLQKDETSYK